MGRQRQSGTKKAIPRERLVSIRKPVLPGYLYVPKGDVYVTRNCRARTLASGLPLYAVHLHGKPNKILGLRVPAAIARTVFTDAAGSKKARAIAVEAKDLRDMKAAKESLVKLYPKLPIDLADAVLRHGFAKKSGRVGRVASMDLERRIVLAVHAFARHKYTRYEILLKTMSKDSARREVQKELDNVVRQWSGSSGLQKSNPKSNLPIKRTVTRGTKTYRTQKKGNKAIQKQKTIRRQGLRTTKAS